MNESEFNQLADSALSRIETAIDACCDEVDCNRSGNLLTVEFDNGAKIIINRHDINQEIWVAAKSGAFHYAWQHGSWLSHRDDSELYATLQKLFTEQGEQISW